MPRTHTISKEAGETIAATIRSARVRSGLSLNKTARLADIALSSLSRIENGYSPLTVGMLLKLAGVLGIPAWKIVRHIERQIAPERQAPQPQSIERE